MGVGLGWLVVYVLVAAGLGALLYKHLFTTMLLVPLVAESVLIKSPWTTSAYWKGVVARFAGLAIANALTYFLYVIPVIYEGKEPWSEEALWAYVVVGVQTVVAAIALLASRRLTRKKPIARLPSWNCRAWKSGCPRRRSP
jgi:H+/Cl- antiporter ClcA